MQEHAFIWSLYKDCQRKTSESIFSIPDKYSVWYNKGHNSKQRVLEKTLVKIVYFSSSNKLPAKSQSIGIIILISSCTRISNLNYLYKFKIAIRQIT